MLRIHAKLSLIVLILGLVDYIGLKLTDTTLLEFVPGYQSQESLLVPMIVFFPVSYGLLYLGLRYGWKTMLPYHISAVTVFFPLIFITTALSFFYGLPAEAHTYYLEEMCANTNEALLCGPAFAHRIFCMTARALPVLVLVPATFYLLYTINFLNVRAMYETIQGN